MRLSSTRGGVVAAALALVGFMLFPVASAEAATCVSVPGGTPGFDVSIGGQPHRVPAISGIQVCAGGSTLPGVTVEQWGGNCYYGCLSVLVGGGSADPEGISVSYRADGVTQSFGVNPGGVGGGDQICVLSVGVPDAPYPTCNVALGIDDPLGGGNLLPDDVCDSVPPQSDPEGWGGTVEFCDDPATWTGYFVTRVCNAVCEDLGYAVVCRLLERVGITCV